MGLYAVFEPVKGSADVALFDLDQSSLELKISGSGDIDATGLDTQRADISVTGYGDVDVQAKVAVRARPTGRAT
ncbi:GIN domain-containing protein [Variovorax gossypii]